MDKVNYELVDVEGLATCLSEDDWKRSTDNIDHSDLYDTVVLSDGEVSKQVKSYWATSFFALRDGYIELIEQFKKPEECKSKEEKKN